MPNFTTPIPPKLTGNSAEDIGKIKQWGTALVDELTYLFNNLDSGNVTEAASVKAENIDATNARISNAQIGKLSADKLKAGSIDTGVVNVRDKNGRLSISGSSIVISDGSRKRFVAEYDKQSNAFRFVLYNKDGDPTVGIGSSGDAVFNGTVESSTIYASTIIGTDSASYQNENGGVFANINQTGIKIMQDKNGRQQKLGMTVANDGTAYLILGAGDGNGKMTFNGVTYTNGSFVVEKCDKYTSMGIIGGKPFITFWDESGDLWLNGNKVYMNGTDVNLKLSNIESEIKSIKSRISALDSK